MNFSLLATVATATLLLACTQANAEDVAPGNSMGLYINVFGGTSSPSDVKTYFDYEAHDYALDLKTGYLFGGAIGMSITDMLRGEVELSHSGWKAKGFNLSGVDGFGNPVFDSDSASGEMSATYLLTNIWADMHNKTAFTPYVGGGAGAGWADANTVFNVSGCPMCATSSYDKGEMGFAFQLGAGLKYDFTENVAMDLGYRYRSILNIDFPNALGFGTFKDGDVNSHNVQLGLTYNF